MTHINTLWNSNREDDWVSSLDEYWRYVKPSHLAVEKEFDPLSTNLVQAMNPDEWYNFLLRKYFFWKYTAPNRYATTTTQLKKYKTSSYGLDELFLIKKRIFNFNKDDIITGLKIASSIKGLGTVGASGLLAVLFPAKFATVDQFAIKALSAIDNLPERSLILSMNPDQLKIKDAVPLIEIMRNKAIELNTKFSTSFWNPRRIDMILWVIQR
jgi:hypothetical protein